MKYRVLACRISLIVSLHSAFFIAFGLAETIPLSNDGGTYSVAVRINDTITLPFVIDTGSTNTVVTSDVLMTLIRSGAVVITRDFIGTGTAVLADGTEIPSLHFILRKLQVGDHVAKDVIASVTSANGDPLLGQSFLSKLPSWTIDNERHALILRGPTERPVLSAINVAELLSRGAAAVALNDYPEAIKWYRLAADKGNAEAQSKIGYFYAKGFGIPQNYVEAARWYRMAAEQGEVNAQNGMGYLYSRGFGVHRDYTEGMRWLNMAATRGDGMAMNNLGVMFAFGMGTSKDCAVARQWIARAAAAGIELAQENLRNGAKGACSW